MMLVAVGEWLSERFTNGIPYPKGTDYKTAWGYLQGLGVRNFALLRMIKDAFIVVVPPGRFDGQIVEGGKQGLISYISFDAGLEEKLLAQAMADPEVLGALARQSWANVAGGYIAEADLSVAEPLILQKGLKQPEALPKGMPVIQANETTVMGMINFLTRVALQGGYNIAFSTEYFDLKDAQAAVPLRQPMPGSVLLAPGIKVHAKELGAAFVISKRTGTIYVIRITEFTSPNWQKPLFYIRTQA